MKHMEEVFANRSPSFETNVKIEQIKTFRFFLDSAIFNEERKNAVIHCPPHWQNQYEILYFVRGEAKVYVDSRAYEVKPGDIVVINKRCVHYIATDTKAYYWVLITSDNMLKDCGFVFNNFMFEEKFSDPKAADLLMDIRKEKNSMSPFAAAKAHIAVLKTISYLADNHALKNISYNKESLPDFIQKSLQYIDANLNKKITVDDIAKHVNISKYYFMREFKYITNLSVTQYVNLAKCKYAQTLLLKGDMSISEISEQLGFDSSTSFYRTFKKHCGLTPKGYIEKYSNSSPYDMY